MATPSFDPSKPFEVVEMSSRDTAPAFDVSKPFEVVADPSRPGLINSMMRQNDANMLEETSAAPVNEYIGKSAELGVRSALGAGLGIAAAIYNGIFGGTSDEDLAILSGPKGDGSLSAEDVKRFKGINPGSYLEKGSKDQFAAGDDAMKNLSVGARKYADKEYLTLDPEKSALLSPTRLIGDVLGSLPSTALLAITARFGGTAATTARTEALAAGATEAVANKAAVAAATKVMTRAGAAGEGALGYEMQYDQTRRQVLDLPQDKIEKSAEYQGLIEDGYTPEKARELLAMRAGNLAGFTAAIVDAGTNLASGPILGKIIGEGGGMISRTARAGGTEAAQEAVQSGGEQAGGNLALQRADPSQELGEGVAEAAAQGAAVGGLTGGAIGLASGQNGLINDVTPNMDERRRVDDYIEHRANETSGQMGEIPAPASSPAATAAIPAILEAPTADAAIEAAMAAVSGPAVDIDAIVDETIGAQERATVEEQQAALVEFGSRLGQLEPTEGDPNTFTFTRPVAGGEPVTGTLKLWDPADAAEGPAGGTLPTISPEVVAAQRDVYGKAGFDVVYFQDDPNLPDGAADPAQPNVIFLSNNPSRNVLQVGQHEITHLLDDVKTPDGRSLGDLLSEQITTGITNEGVAHAFKIFGDEAPDRSQFPATPEGQAAHADAVRDHLIKELGADIGGEAPKFQTWIPRVMEAIETRYGRGVVTEVMNKFLNGLREAMVRMQTFFSGGERSNTLSQNWVSNLDEIHDTLAQMNAVRYGSAVQREQAKLSKMKDTAARDRLAAGEAVVAEASAAPIAGKPAPAAGYKEARTKAQTLRRWLGELDVKRRTDAAASEPVKILRQQEATMLKKVGGVESKMTKVGAERLAAVRAEIEDRLNPKGDSPDMARVREAMVREHARMAEATAVTKEAAAMPRAARPAPTPKAEAAPAVEPVKAEAPKPASKETGEPTDADRFVANQVAQDTGGNPKFSPKVADLSDPTEPNGNTRRAREVEIDGATISYSMHPSQDGMFVEVNAVSVEPRQRRKGRARKAMDKFLAQTDAAGLKTFLTAEPMGQGGAPKSALEKFYKSLGFTPNRGRARDFGTRAALVREAKVAANPQKADQTDTPAFKKWFRDSVVVDGNKKPMVVYHGTPDDFTEFEPGDGWYGRGIYFTDNAEYAGEFATENAEDGETGARTVPAFLSLQRPYIFRERLNDTASNVQLMHELGFSDAKINRSFETGEDLIRPALERMGHDGIVVLSAEGRNEYIAFEPEQIKSSTGNVGTFDAQNPDIRFSPKAKPQTKTKAFKDWFGNSKVVDVAGKPLVVYHGTVFDIDTFDPQRRDSGRGRGGKVRPAIYFTANKDDANWYATWGENKELFAQELEAAKNRPADIVDWGGGYKYKMSPFSMATEATYVRDPDGGTGANSGANVTPVFLKAENPLIVDMKGRPGFGQGHIRRALAAGNDGVILRNSRTNQDTEPSDHFVVFKSEQVKSAIGNSGAFDPKDKRIQFSPKQRETDEFRRWFSGSKITDRDGNPVILYHATPEDFDAFKPGGKDPEWSGPAIWLSPYRDSQPAAHNTGGYQGQFKDGTNVIPVYAAIKNPLFIDNRQMLDWSRETFAGGSSQFPLAFDAKTRDALIAEGYDGIVYAGPQVYNNSAKEYGDVGVGEQPKREEEVVALFANQLKSAISNTGGFSREDDRILFSPKQTKTKAFKEWFADSKVVDSKENPLIVYHGTTADFDAFNRERGNIESDWGAGFYFTNERDDVSENYAGMGPDLTNKVQREAERIASETDREYNDPEVVAEARAKYAVHEGATIPAYLSIQNPVIVGGKGETYFDYEENYNEELDEFGEPTGSLVDLVTALRAASESHGDVDIEDVVGQLFEAGMDGGLSASQAEDIMRKNDGLIYATDLERGDLSGHELVRQAFEAMGFDGIIDRRANQKFGSEKDPKTGQKMAGMKPGTVHYIAFAPEQVKSAIGNSGAFSKEDSRIQFSPKISNGPFYSALTRAVEGAKTEKATPGQWMGTIKNTPGVKAEEIEWSGVDQFLNKHAKTVTKADLLDHLRENEVEVREVMKRAEGEYDRDIMQGQLASERLSELQNKDEDDLTPSEERLMVWLMDHQDASDSGYLTRAYDIWLDDHRHLPRIDPDDLAFQLIEARDGEKRVGPEIDEEISWLQAHIADRSLAADGPEDGGVTKYDDYTLPGGRNYRELLLTLPPTMRTIDEYKVIRADGTTYGTYDGKEAADRAVKLIDGGRVEPGRATTVAGGFKSSHWAEPNILAHIRFDDRMVQTYTPDDVQRIGEKIAAALGVKPSSIASGAPAAAVKKGAITRLEAAQFSHAAGFRGVDTAGAVEKVLHVAEIQSDWHQAGRKRGYKQEVTKEYAESQGYSVYRAKSNLGTESYFLDGPDNIRNIPNQGHDTEEGAWAEMLAFIKKNNDVVPDAPFKTTWQEMAMKRVLRYAAENGYDRVTWDTGATNADRYDLSKQIEMVYYYDNGNDTFDIIAEPKSGGEDIKKNGLTAKDLEDTLGKDVARKIIENEGKPSKYHDEGWSFLKGVDLRIGGEGMVGFYDKILPAFVSKYVKKWGAKLERGTVTDPYFAASGAAVMAEMGMPVSKQKAYWAGLDQSERDRLLDDYRKRHRDTAVHSVAITPAMRESVMQGQPMFSPKVRPEVREELERANPAYRDMFRSPRGAPEPRQMPPAAEPDVQPAPARRTAPAAPVAPPAPPPVIDPAEEPAETNSPLVAPEKRPRALSLQSIKGEGELRRRAINGELYNVAEELPQMEAADALVAKDLDKAIAIAMRERQSIPGVLPEFVFMAVEQHAKDTNNVDLQRRLSNSRIAEEATDMGRRIAAWRNRGEIAPVEDMRRIREAREARAKAKKVDVKKEVDKVVDAGLAASRAEAKSTKKVSINEFVLSMICPT